ncbi:precorrin-3B C(17)-methyltransferase [Schwartzia sp. (in: firmicutes)]
MGKIVVVGLGPGSMEQMTPRARKAIEEAQVVAGYTTYIKLIEPLLKDKEVIGTGMMQEVDRCKLAVKTAAEGKDTVMVSSGDSGVYGMAGLILEIVETYPEDTRPQVEIIPGLSAVNAAASVLGAPLMHDFAVISLSDRLTKWDLICKRLDCAAQADFVIALYNPKSKTRVKHIEEAREILLRHKDPSTPVGIVKNAARPGEEKILSTLENFTKEDIDMFSLVIIGNSKTYIKDNWMITPRGYNV